MKKLILISLLTISSSLFAGMDIGVRVQTPIGNHGVLDIGIRSDDHRYNNRYKEFDYNRHAYNDNYGYLFGYFDRIGYFYNNIFFTYDNRYTYYDRLHRRGYFNPRHVHFRDYKYHNDNDWNRTHRYREQNQVIYGPYHDNRNYKQKEKMERNYKEEKYNKNNSKQYNNKNQNNNGQKNSKRSDEYNKHK